MVKNKSAKGSALERAVAHLLVEKGYSVVRGAGSKSYGPGKIDLVAINPTSGMIYLIQCKNFERYGAAAVEKERSELWRVFNGDFKKNSYTLKCEGITRLSDVDLIP